MAFKKGHQIRLGAKLSNATKKKMSLSALRVGKGLWMIGRKGKNAPNWKGGKTSSLMLDRTSKAQDRWRLAVFNKYNWTCQKTGEKDKKKLRTHHIQSFTNHPELRFEIDNGIVLSKDAHTLFHIMYGSGFTTKEQLFEFLNNKSIIVG